MKVALVQVPLFWEDVVQNMDLILKELSTIVEETDLVVLPEMFTSGFTMRPSKVSIDESHEFFSVLKALSKAKGFAITGSVVIEEDGGFFNRLYFITPSGHVDSYDKRHLFSLAGEEKVYTPGKDRLIVSYKGWNICPLVCYDVRFAVFSRNVGCAYDLLLYVASWPDQRIYAWDSLLKARAIENMTYVVGVNRCGEDENNNQYTGHSQALGFLGEYLQAPMVGRMISYVTLDKQAQDKARDRFGFLADADQFTLVN